METQTNINSKPFDRRQSATGGNPFFVMCLSRSHLLCEFDYLASEKGLSGDDLNAFALRYWKWSAANGHHNCPFPEWLVKFAKGDWDPFE